MTASPTQNQDQNFKQTFQGLNRKFEEEQTQRKAGQWNLPYFHLSGFPVDQEDLELLDEETARAVRAIAFFSEGDLVKIGAVDPADSRLNSAIAEMKKQNKKVELYVISDSAFREAFKQYGKAVKVKEDDTKQISVSLDTQALKRLKDLTAGAKQIKEMPITELLELVLSAASSMEASDVHLEPGKNRVELRFRVDGVLQEIGLLPQEVYQRLLSRIKLLSGLKLNITDKPQDGRFSAKLDQGDSLDMRVSALPSAFGETVAVRLLGLINQALAIDELGLSEQAAAVVKRGLKQSTGMILTTGPTGSGKTTTLYSFLTQLNRPGVNIITLEDPIEYRLEGITQAPINRSKGVDFAGALRASLRQDPDIIMVGEIRDAETAETATQAALTGHVVLSTLHTNDAAGSIPRLLDMRVKPVNLAPALNALIAQRLVRKICPDCKQPYEPGPEESRHINLALEEIKKSYPDLVPQRLKLYHSEGCPACHSLSYKGRIGVFEAFSADEEIKQLIFEQASSMQIKKTAVKSQKMLTMQQDAILKALQGITDLAEVWRVTGE